jgi:hypothetical protein
MLVHMLNTDFPSWKEYIEYIDVDNMTEEQKEILLRLKILRIPTLTNEKEIIKINSNPSLAVTQIKKLCLIKE